MAREIFAGVDIETTGTKVGKHGLIQIGISTEDKFEFVSDVNPGAVQIEEEAMGINGFTPERIAKAPSTEAVAQNLFNALQEWYGGERVRIIAVGWNVGSFDLPFIDLAFPEITSKFFSYRTCDLNAVCFTLDRARKGLKGVMRYDGLKKDAKRYAEEVLAAKGVGAQWHDALYDAKAGMLAWERLRQKVMVND